LSGNPESFQKELDSGLRTAGMTKNKDRTSILQVLIVQKQFRIVLKLILTIKL
jgi:hypothetical protein